MTVSDVYLCCDNLRPGAELILYTKAANYINRELAWKITTYYEADRHLLLADVSAFFVEPDGESIHIRVVV